MDDKRYLLPLLKYL